MLQAFYQLRLGFFGRQAGDFFQAANMFFLVLLEFGALDIDEFDLAV